MFNTRIHCKLCKLCLRKKKEDERRRKKKTKGMNRIEIFVFGIVDLVKVERNFYGIDLALEWLRKVVSDLF